MKTYEIMLAVPLPRETFCFKAECTLRSMKRIAVDIAFSKKIWPCNVLYRLNYGDHWQHLNM